MPVNARGLARWSLALSVPVVAACGTAGPTVVEIAAPKVAATAQADPAEVEDAAAGSGCTWTGEIAWAREEALPLCFEKEGACFAEAPSPFRGKVKLWLPPGEPEETGGRLDLGVDGIRVRAWTDAAAVVLHPGEPAVFGQIAIPLEAEKIRLDRVIDRDLDLSLRAWTGFSPRGGALRARAPCAAVGLEHKSYSNEAVRGVIGARAQPIGERTLPVGKALSISGSASGPVMADVTPEDSDTRVELLEQSGGRSRILWWRDDVVLFGWVDTAALGPPPSGPEYGQGFGTGRGRLAPGNPAGTRCRRDLSLFAMVHGTKRRGGVIERGTVFDRDLPTADRAFVAVGLRTTSLRLTEGSRWLVPAGALAGCE